MRVPWLLLGAAAVTCTMAATDDAADQPKLLGADALVTVDIKPLNLTTNETSMLNSGAAGAVIVPRMKEFWTAGMTQLADQITPTTMKAALAGTLPGQTSPMRSMGYTEIFQPNTAVSGNSLGDAAHDQAATNTTNTTNTHVPGVVYKYGFVVMTLNKKDANGLDVQEAVALSYFKIAATPDGKKYVSRKVLHSCLVANCPIPSGYGESGTAHTDCVKCLTGFPPDKPSCEAVSGRLAEVDRNKCPNLPFSIQ